jgi:phosphohistidine phosphatase SixA
MPFTGIMNVVDLYILRHGKAEHAHNGVDDSKRNLTEKGKDEVQKISWWMISQNIDFDLIATSPLNRAQRPR